MYSSIAVAGCMTLNTVAGYMALWQWLFLVDSIEGNMGIVFECKYYRWSHYGYWPVLFMPIHVADECNAEFLSSLHSICLLPLVLYTRIGRHVLEEHNMVQNLCDWLSECMFESGFHHQYLAVWGHITSPVTTVKDKYQLLFPVPTLGPASQPSPAQPSPAQPR